MHELRESQMRSDRAAILTRHRDPDRSRDVRAARRRARVCADPHAGFRPAGGGVRGDCRMRALLIPQTAIRGAWLLVAVFVMAILLHLLHGMYGIGNLVIYAAAAFAIAVGKGN